MEEKKYEQQLFDDIADYIMEAHSVSVPESKITATGIMNILAEFTTALHPSQPEGDGWVSVEDRLPDGRMETCLVFNADELLHKQHQRIAQYFQQIGGFITGVDDYKVTHWQPLPKSPK